METNAPYSSAVYMITRSGRINKPELCAVHECVYNYCGVGKCKLAYIRLVCDSYRVDESKVPKGK